MIAQRLHLGRLISLALALALLVTLAPVGAPAHAAIDGGAEAQFISQLNQARQSAGLAPVKVAGDLTAVARRHSERMGGQDDLHHNPNLGSDVSGWQKVGENVGRGPSVGAIHSAFMDSPGHRANILGGDWVEVGVGAVVIDGQLWVTQVFRLPSSAAAASEPAAPAAAPEAPAAETSPDTASPNGNAPSNAAAADGAGDTTAASAPAADPEPRVTPPGPRHEVDTPPLPLDRLQLTLERLEATETAATPA